jgi:hypothetical protein
VRLCTCSRIISVVFDKSVPKEDQAAPHMWLLGAYPKCLLVAWAIAMVVRQFLRRLLACRYADRFNSTSFVFLGSSFHRSCRGAAPNSELPLRFAERGRAPGLRLKIKRG